MTQASPAPTRALGTGEVDAIYTRSTVIDGSIAPKMDEAQVDRMKRSGVTAVNWTVCMPWHGLSTTLKEIAAGIEVIRRYSADLVLATTAAEVREAKRAGKIAIIFGPQNARPCEEGTFAFRVLYEMGVRILQLTYNERNLFGDGAAEPDNAGLSVLGRQAIEEMDRLGIVLDLSHCGDKTTLQAIEASRNPVIITHANARAVHPSPRNKTDEHLKALAARGGVVGLALWSPMLAYDHWPTLEDYKRQMSYVADLIGIEHVAIGSDHNESADKAEWTWNSSKQSGRYQSVTGKMGDWYVYETRCAKDGSSVLDLPKVAQAVASLGLTAKELEGVLGGNFLRVCEQVWGG